MNRKSGLSILDVIIIILIVGIIAALLIPKARMNKVATAEKECRGRLTEISNAMMKFFTTAGDTAKINQPDVSPVPVDSTVKAEVKKAVKKGKAVQDSIPPAPPRLFTDDAKLLKPYLPDSFKFECPLDGKSYIFIARDSVFYSISCPNGHGQIIKGEPTWEM